MVNKQGGASSGSKRKPFVAATTTEEEDDELNKSTAFIETGSDTINKSEFETIIKSTSNSARTISKVSSNQKMRP